MLGNFTEPSAALAAEWSVRSDFMEPGTFWLGLAAVTIVNASITVLCAFLSGYGTKKGENWATHEDIQKVVAQVEAVTTATEAIKSAVLNEAWARQQHITMKRDALLKVLEELANAEEFLAEFIGMQGITKPLPEFQAELREERKAIFKNLKSAQRALRHATYLAMVSSDSAMSERLDNLYFLIVMATTDAIAGKRDEATSKTVSLRFEVIGLTEVVRNELGLPERSLK